MTCIDYEAWISAELDGELPSDETARLEAHLSVCDTCRRVRDGYRVDRLMVRGMARQAAPADAHARLMATLANRPAMVSTQAPAVISPKIADAVSVAASRTWQQRLSASAVRGLRAVASLAIVLLGALVYLGVTDPEPEVPVVPAATRSVTVRPRALVRGHAYRQAVNPTADQSSWHFLAIDEETVLPSGDDDEETLPEATREI